MKDKIDFVILWVDCNDPEWRKKKSSYMPPSTSDNSEARYRDWDNLRYWFRSVAKYAPWVNMIHFVSDHQVPNWINIDNPRIHLVNHSDYMPSEALPVFNSSAIEIALHRIPQLSDKFVYFNDDMFLTSPVSPDFFFHNDKPVDMPGLTRPCYSLNAAQPMSTFSSMLYNDLQIINRQYSKKAVLTSQFSKWFRLSYGKTFIRTLINVRRSQFDGLVMPHLAVPYRKQDIERVWSMYGTELEKVQYNRFRDNSDRNHFLYRFWRLCEGDYHARASKGKYIALKDLESVSKACKIIRNQRQPQICINDCWDNGDFQVAKERIIAAFDSVLSEKCEFEK